jgi:hypothetical protein
MNKIYTVLLKCCLWAEFTKSANHTSGSCQIVFGGDLFELMNKLKGNLGSSER